MCRLRLWDHLLTGTSVSVKRSISPLSSINHSTLNGLNSISLSLLWLRTANVRAVEEAHEQIHQRSQVKNVEPGSERLSVGVEAVNRAVSGDSRLHLSRSLRRLSDGFGETLSSCSSVNNALHSITGSLSSSGVVDSLSGINDNALNRSNWDIVRDEAVGGGVVDADDELANLKGCKGLLDGLWNSNAECCDGVVCVLNFRVS